MNSFPAVPHSTPHSTPHADPQATPHAAPHAVLARRSVLGLAAAGLAATLLAAPAPAQARPLGIEAKLPAPTGPHRIGTVSTRLVDTSRHDPWVKSVPYRELMISVWYPAAGKTGMSGGAEHRPAPYMTPGAAERWNATSPHGIPKDAIDFAAMRTHAREGAPADTSGGRRPVLLYASGANDPRTWGTSAVEELASHGYVVVTIDHTYEAPGVQFPDGSVKDDAPLRKALEEAEQNEALPALLKKVLDVRVADSTFVLDRLGSLPHGLSKVVDQKRVGMFGQSAGGIAAAETMYEDSRVRAGVNMDGTLENNPEPNGTNLTPVAQHGLTRPFLLMGSQGNDRTTEPSWREFWSHTTGWKRNLTLRGSRHQTYTDLSVLLPQAGVDRKVIEENIGTVAPDRAVAAERAYVTSFFDRWLRGQDDHLLDAPSKRYPEVEFAG